MHGKQQYIFKSKSLHTESACPIYWDTFGQKYLTSHIQMTSEFDSGYGTSYTENEIHKPALYLIKVRTKRISPPVSH